MRAPVKCAHARPSVCFREHASRESTLPDIRRISRLRSRTHRVRQTRDVARRDKSACAFNKTARKQLRKHDDDAPMHVRIHRRILFAKIHPRVHHPCPPITKLVNARTSVNERVCAAILSATRRDPRACAASRGKKRSSGKMGRHQSDMHVAKCALSSERERERDRYRKLVGPFFLVYLLSSSFFPSRYTKFENRPNRERSRAFLPTTFARGCGAQITPLRKPPPPPGTSGSAGFPSREIPEKLRNFLQPATRQFPYLS